MSGKGSGRRKENTSQVEENLDKVDFTKWKPSREWESSESKARRMKKNEQEADTNSGNPKKRTRPQVDKGTQQG